MEFFNDVGSDPLRPSLFELVAQEQLRDLLQPALKYVLAVFAQRHPRYLLRIVNRHEEFYATAMFFVERHYLKVEGASFAENFYGLKRRRRPWIETPRAIGAVGSVRAEEKLRSQEIWKSLLFLVGVPYIRAKAQDYYEQLGGGLDSDILNIDVTGSSPSAPESQLRVRCLSWPNRLRKLFKLLYPWANTSFELWLVAWNVAYLFDKTSFYRPWLSWIGVDLRRLGTDDLRPNTAAIIRRPTSDSNKSGLESLRRMLLSSPRLLLDFLKILLPMSIFFVKFLEWWYSPSSPARNLSRTPSGPPIPPPRMLRPHPQGLPVGDLKYGDCPICRNAIVNATALPSGYVFCYRCAHAYVEKNSNCPVTLLPARLWQLRKVLV
ncbi:hypothetical protein K439DRAFT_1326978 [Ramaria rubella]|nr:hypothetical protein K439DRAFT_1326978 [Ramaria rubella]